MLLTGNVKGALAGGERAMGEIVMATHAGMTTAEFETLVRDWTASAKHPKTGRLYTEMKGDGVAFVNLSEIVRSTRWASRFAGTCWGRR